MTDFLHEIFRLQQEFQQSLGYDFETMHDAERITYIKDMTLASTDEAHEFLGEIGWKPWATSRHINHAAAKGELVDEFHFFVNRCLAVGMTADELFDKYVEKRSRNVKRQMDGYDGVAGKCPTCRRDFSDIDVARKNTAVSGFRYTGTNGVVYCSKLCSGEV